jgi:RNA polymerase sigma-70 factor (ECF subfamily)
LKTTQFDKELLAVQADLKNYARKLTANEEEAKDLLQETTLKALKGSNGYKLKSNIFGWTQSIMHNTHLNNCKREKLKRNIFKDCYYSKEMSKKPAAGETSVYDSVIIYKYIEQLPEKYRCAFEMSIDGFKYNEIAQHLNIPVGNVKRYIFTSRKKLRKQLKEFRK